MALDRPSTRVLARLLGPDADGDGGQPPDPATPEGLRALVDRIARLNGPGPRPVREGERVVPGTQVRVRLLGVAEPPNGLIVVFGLGGWVAGAPGPQETVARKLAERTSCDVALIDFRRAPEHPYPAAAEDVDVAVRWLWRERGALGLGGSPLMILGEGMGAALAAGAVHRALGDPDGPRFALQLLVCPVLDAAVPGSAPDPVPAPDPDPAAGTGAPGGLLSRAVLDRLWGCYLTDPGLRSESAASPARAGDWTGAPPTLVITAGHDAAAGEGAAFAARLRASGVPTVERHFPDQMHGFFSILAARMGERAFQHVVRLVRGYTARAARDAVPPPAELDAWLERTAR